MKILRVLIFANLRIDLHPQKLVLTETPFGQIKNSAFNGLVPLGRYKLDLNICGSLLRKQNSVKRTRNVNIRLVRMGHLHR